MIDKRRVMGYNKWRMDNVILIGMPSSGKSTAGRILAEKISFGFIDTDLTIAGEEGAPLSEIILKHGVDGFIKIEERVNAGLSASRCVVATGGSVVYSERAMEHLKKLGKVVYLKIGKDEVLKRIPSFEKRGVVMRGNISSLSELYDERVPLYEKYADITIDCNGQAAEETVSVIIEKLG